jgi:phage recombination protein Bet
MTIHQSFSLTARQIELVRRTVARDCSREEFDLFIEAARQCRLDPFRRQIMPLIFNKRHPERRRMVILVGVDGQRVLAQRCGNYRPASEPPDYVYRKELKGPTNPLGILYCRTRLWLSTAVEKPATWRRKSLPLGHPDLMLGRDARLGMRAPRIAGVCQGALAWKANRVAWPQALAAVFLVRLWASR